MNREYKKRKGNKLKKKKHKDKIICNVIKMDIHLDITLIHIV